MVDIEILSEELCGRIRTVSAVSGKTFIVYNLEDLEGLIRDQVSFPLIGVSHVGTHPSSGNDGTASSGKQTSSAVLDDVSFSVIFGDEYRYTDNLDNNRRNIVRLMKEVRDAVRGYVGVSNRPWRFRGETPLVTGIENAVFYGQVWAVTTFL